MVLEAWNLSQGSVKDQTCDGAHALLRWSAEQPLFPDREWSIAEVGLSEYDFAKLQDWYRALPHWFVETEIDRGGTVEVPLGGGATPTIPWAAQFGLLLVAAFAECARRQGAGPLWPRICEGLSGSERVRRLLFNASGQPTPPMVALLEQTVRGLRLRHAYDDELGDRRYYRTIHLQFGYHVRGTDQIRRALANAPTSDDRRIRDRLCESSASFKRFWGVLQTICDRGSTRDLTAADRDVLDKTPWILRGDREALVEVVIRRAPAWIPPALDRMLIDRVRPVLRENYAELDLEFLPRSAGPVSHSELSPETRYELVVNGTVAGFCDADADAGWVKVAAATCRIPWAQTAIIQLRADGHVVQQWEERLWAVDDEGISRFSEGAVLFPDGWSAPGATSVVTLPEGMLAVSTNGSLELVDANGEVHRELADPSTCLADVSSKPVPVDQPIDCTVTMMPGFELLSVYCAGKRLATSREGGLFRIRGVIPVGRATSELFTRAIVSKDRHIFRVPLRIRAPFAPFLARRDDQGHWNLVPSTGLLDTHELGGTVRCVAGRGFLPERTLYAGTKSMGLRGEAAAPLREDSLLGFGEPLHIESGVFSCAKRENEPPCQRLADHVVRRGLLSVLRPHDTDPSRVILELRDRNGADPEYRVVFWMRDGTFLEKDVIPQTWQLAVDGVAFQEIAAAVLVFGKAWKGVWWSDRPAPPTHPASWLSAVRRMRIPLLLPSWRAAVEAMLEGHPDEVLRAWVFGGVPLGFPSSLASLDERQVDRDRWFSVVRQVIAPVRKPADFSLATDCEPEPPSQTTSIAALRRVMQQAGLLDPVTAFGVADAGLDPSLDCKSRAAALKRLRNWCTGGSSPLKDAQIAENAFDAMRALRIARDRGRFNELARDSADSMWPRAIHLSAFRSAALQLLLSP